MPETVTQIYKSFRDSEKPFVSSNISEIVYIISSHSIRMAEEKTDTKVDLGLLEGDDEFEEFPPDSAQAAAEEDKEVSVWEDNWDDDNVEDDFAQQLR